MPYVPKGTFECRGEKCGVYEAFIERGDSSEEVVDSCNSHMHELPFTDEAINTAQYCGNAVRAVFELPEDEVHLEPRNSR